MNIQETMAVFGDKLEAIFGTDFSLQWDTVGSDLKSLVVTIGEKIDWQREECIADALNTAILQAHNGQDYTYRFRAVGYLFAASGFKPC